MEEETLQIESIVDGRWRVEEKIGRGGFGEIYQCTDVLTNKSVALKLICTTISIPGVPNLRDEAKILKAVQGKKFFAHYFAFGRTSSFDFLVMELLGPNLKTVTNHFPRKKIPVEITLINGRMMLRAIKWLHEAGYIHRDIKPSNFAIGIEKAGRVYLIDFGLSKRYVFDSGELCPLKNKVSFMGTARYSSVNVLLCKDAGRRDDLISLFYSLVDMSVSKLPWRKIECRKEMAVLKKSCDYASLIEEFPTEFLQFYEEANQLKTLQKPNYESLLQILNNCLRKCANPTNNYFDGENFHFGNGGITQGNDSFSDPSVSSLTSSSD